MPRMDERARDKQLLERWLSAARQEVAKLRPPQRPGRSLHAFDRFLFGGAYEDAARMLLALSRDCVTGQKFATQMALVADLLGHDDMASLEAA